MNTCIYIGATADNLTAVRAPTEYSQSIQDLDSSSTTRSANGTMVRSVVRQGASAIRKLELKWSTIPIEDVKEILDYVKGTFIWVKYPDCVTGSMRTAEFYVGDRKCTFKRVMKGDTGEYSDAMLNELSFNLIER